MIICHFDTVWIAGEARRMRLCRNSRVAQKVVMPAQAGIQNSLMFLDSGSRFACPE
jgi:hypothetical protein